MSKHRAESEFPLTTEEVFGPPVAVNVRGELEENPAYQAVPAEDKRRHLDDKLLVRSELIDKIHTSSAYKKLVEETTEADMVAELDAQEAYHLAELERIRAQRRVLGMGALKSDRINQ